MPLALLTKDSILDLAALDAESSSQQGRHSSRNSSPTPHDDNDDDHHHHVVHHDHSETVRLDVDVMERGLEKGSDGSQRTQPETSSTKASSTKSAVNAPDTANPQQPPIAFHYAGYEEDYYYDDNDQQHHNQHHHHHNQYASADYLMAQRNESGAGGLWSCLFPWMQPKPAPTTLPAKARPIAAQPVAHEVKA